jgi:hypothetical protein
MSKVTMSDSLKSEDIQRKKTTGNANSDIPRPIIICITRCFAKGIQLIRIRLRNNQIK